MTWQGCRTQVAARQLAFGCLETSQGAGTRFAGVLPHLAAYFVVLKLGPVFQSGAMQRVGPLVDRYIVDDMVSLVDV